MDGLEWNWQWWGEGRRRRDTATDPVTAVRLAKSPAFRRRWDAERLRNTGNVTRWEASPPVELVNETPEGRERRAVVHQIYRWPNGIIPYTVDPTMPAASQAKIAQAMTEYTSKTCVRFVARQAEQYYLRFRSSTMCVAQAVGRSTPGPANIFISTASDCDLSEVLHKIGHGIGMMHESNRADRDTYVNVFPSNSDNPIYFTRTDARGGAVFTSASDIGTYDIFSVMHPREADDLEPSLVGTSAVTMSLTAAGSTLAGGSPFGRGSVLTTDDEAKIETMYGNMCLAQLGGDHRCEWTVVSGDSLAGIAANVNGLFSLTVTVSDLVRMNEQSYPTLSGDPSIQIGWVIRFCYLEGTRGFVVDVPVAPLPGSGADMVDTDTFLVG